MTPLTIAVVALVLGLVVGTAAVVGAPVFAIPIVIAALAAIGLVELRRRAATAGDVRELREQAKAEKVEFTERDKRTTA